jgi:uncharacterized membrane protein
MPAAGDEALTSVVKQQEIEAPRCGVRHGDLRRPLSARRARPCLCGGLSRALAPGSQTRAHFPPDADSVHAMQVFEHVRTVGDIIDVAGVAVIALGGVVAVGVALGRLLRRSGDAYLIFREEFGRSILLGLELLVAADIIRTVAITPTKESVTVLAGIVLIRTFLSFSLEVEMTGKWPWQQNPSHFPATRPAPEAKTQGTAAHS